MVGIDEQLLDDKLAALERARDWSPRSVAKLEALLQAQGGAARVVVPLRTSKVPAKSGLGDAPIEGVSAAELGARIENEMVGWDGIEPPTPGFSVLCSTN